MSPLPLFVILLTLGLAPGALAQDATPPPETVSTQGEEPEKSALRLLLIEFDGVIQSIPKGELHTDRARETLAAMAAKFAAYNATATTPSAEGLTQEILIATLLEDHPAVDFQVKRFLDAFPDRIDMALRWASYTGTRNPTNMKVVFDELERRFPDNPKLVVEQARRLRWDARFEEAVSKMELLDEEERSQINAAVIYSDALYGAGRFSEAVEALEVVTEGQLDMADRGIARKYVRILPDRRAIIASWEAEQERRALDAAKDDLPRVLLETSKGPIVIELFEDDAPNTVANFISLVESGFYDSTAFHRVVRTFMTQGGDPHTKPGQTGQVGNGHPGWGIADEATAESHRKHFSGAVAMAKHRAPNSGGSQFYITHQPTPHLDGRQTVFGRVITGLDTARWMNVRDRLLTATVIRKRDHEYAVAKIEAYELPNAPDADLPGWDEGSPPLRPSPSNAPTSTPPERTPQTSP